jgi:hypothetical protein
MTTTADDAQLQNLEKLLRQWSNSIVDNTKDIVNSAVGKLNAENSVEGGVGILNDVRDRQSRVISVRIVCEIFSNSDVTRRFHF